MSSAKNKTISALQRSIRSFSNSPSRKPFHLTGELRQSSPVPERKSRQSRKDYDLKDLSLDEDLIIISDFNNNNVKASTSKSKETGNEKPTKYKLKAQTISKRSQSATNYIDDKYEETSSDESEEDDDFVPEQIETGKKGKSAKTSASKTAKPKKDVKRNAKDIKPTRVPKPSCGICGSKTRKLTRTECCGNLICGRDQPLGRFRPFSFSAASCFSDHNKYTLCCFHFNEGHKGKWQDCKQCSDFEKIWHGYEDMYDFKPIEGAKTITCVNCGFAAENPKAFHNKPGHGHYCLKKKCNEVKNNLKWQ